MKNLTSSMRRDTSFAHFFPKELSAFKIFEFLCLYKDKLIIKGGNKIICYIIEEKYHNIIGNLA